MSIIVLENLHSRQLTFVSLCLWGLNTSAVTNICSFVWRQNYQNVCSVQDCLCITSQVHTQSLIVTSCIITTVVFYEDIVWVCLYMLWFIRNNALSMYLLWKDSFMTIMHSSKLQEIMWDKRLKREPQSHIVYHHWDVIRTRLSVMNRARQSYIVQCLPLPYFCTQCQLHWSSLWHFAKCPCTPVFVTAFVQVCS